jgi:ATP-dependent helicase/nuclease subunit B
VEVIGAVSAEGAARQRLLSEALRPAETTDAWAAARDRGLAPAAVEASLVGLDLLIARNEREEALAVALAVRKALADGLATIAVVTPDRGIGRRVAAELGRFGLAIDDSAGAPLDSLPAGIFARLLVEAVAADGDAVALLALLKHPFACFGLGHAHCRAAARALERAVLRGRRVVGGIAALGEALAAARSAPADAGHAPVSRQGLSPGDWDLAVNLVSALGATLLPLKEALAASGPVSAAALTRLLIPAIQSAARDEGGSDAALWAGRAGEGLAELLAGLAGSEADALELAPPEYADFLGALMGEIVVAPEPGADPRVHIWGTLEARLQSVDFLVLAGLDEGVWPQDVRTDAFLSRAMRAELGLAAPERRIGLAAHDFAAGMAAPRVLVTRAEKRGGAPTVESRWLQRLTAFIGPEARQALAARGRAYGAIADVLDRSPPGAVRSAPRPRPSPPVAARPRRLSITEIETLIRDPYAVYARHVLGLVPFEPLGVAPDYALRGSLIHEALGRFTAGWTGPYAAAAEEALLQIGAEVLSEIAGFPDIHAVWSLRFRAIAAWFIAWERGRASEIAARHPEIPGRIEIPAPAGAFSLRGRADRIDIRRDGSVEIYDFKTGTPPSARQVLTGFAPQLALEAMMVRDGAFPPVPAGRSLSVLSWIALGQVDRGVALKSAVERDFTADAVAESARAELAALLAAFDDPAREYLSRARPMFETRFEGDYDHLARVREWGLAETGGEGE